MFSSSSQEFDLHPPIIQQNQSSNTFIWIFINIFLSIISIYILHLSWSYIQTNYSTKKSVGGLDKQIEKYKKIIDEMQKRNESSLGPVDYLPQPDEPLFSNDYEKEQMMRLLLASN